MVDEKTIFYMQTNKQLTYRRVNRISIRMKTTARTDENKSHTEKKNTDEKKKKKHPRRQTKQTSIYRRKKEHGQTKNK